MPVHPLVGANELFSTVHLPYDEEPAVMKALPLWLAYCEYGQAVADGDPVALNVDPLSSRGPDQLLLEYNLTCVSVNEPLIHAGLVVVGDQGIDEACNITSLSMKLHPLNSDV